MSGDSIEVVFVVCLVLIVVVVVVVIAVVVVDTVVVLLLDTICFVFVYLEFYMHEKCNIIKRGCIMVE